MLTIHMVLPAHGNSIGAHLYKRVGISLNTLATGYGDFRTSVASGRHRATEISVFTPTGGWKSGLVLLGFVMFCYVVIQP